MNKRMKVMLALLFILFGGIFGWKFVKNKMIAHAMAEMGAPAISVSVATVSYSDWRSELKSVGSVRAIVGVNVTTELAGMVQAIYFTPGTYVKKDKVLVQLNAGTEVGQLHSLQAQKELAKITYHRDKAQYAVHAVSKQTLDSDLWTLKNLEGQVDEQAATVNKKTIRAPFAGQLGISYVNPGQYLNVGDKVTSLQTVDPIYVDFYLPQDALAVLKLGQVVSITADTFPNVTFPGKITTINPAVDTDTRNIEVEATLPNPKHELTPGMFTQVMIVSGEPKRFLTLPQSAITFNPYGNIAYIVQSSGTDKIVEQRFVNTGETRGDQIQILSGLKSGDTVVTSGQLKLKNGSKVTLNNKVQPENMASPVIAPR